MPDTSFRLTQRAKQDLNGIWEYTLGVWGEAQADAYIKDLFKRFDWIAGQPKLGKHRSDICEGYYCFPHQSHLVFYLIREGGIDIIGVIHKQMDILNYFE